MSLRNKAITGFSWTFIQQFSVQLIGFLVQLFLARLLMPSEFGLIAMIAIFMSIGNVLIDSGLTSSLIRTENIVQADLSTVFYTNVGASVVIYFLIFCSAPFIADFYHQPSLVSIIRCYTVSFIINSFVSVQSTILSKELKFRKQMMIQMPITVISGVCGIGLAYLNYGVWALVWMNIIQSILNVLFHWFKSDWYPKLLFSKERFKYHIKFGYKLALSGILDATFENLSGILIGRFFPVNQLAFYNRALSLEMLPVQNISTALNKVTYPLFSKIQNDDQQLKKTYRLLLTQVFFWTLPCMLLLQIVAKPLVIILLTAKWVGIVPYLQILCFHGILYPLHVYNLNILLVKGRSDLFFKLEIIKRIIFILGIPIIFWKGIEGMAWWLVICSVISFYINSMYSGKLIGYSFIDQLKSMMPILILGFSVWGVLLFLKTNLGIITGNVPIVISMFFMFFILYFVIAILFKMKAIVDIKNIISKKSIL